MKSYISILLLLSFNSYAAELSGYGFLKTSIISSNQKVMSFNADNHAAPTHAGRIDDSSEAQEEFDTQRRTSFQSQQSRFGLIFKQNDNLSGRVEFDFVDFTTSSAGAGLQTRERLAQIDYQWGEGWSVSAGQKWLTVTGLAPHTFNFIQNSFYAGNSGFIGQEMALKKSWRQTDIYFALGGKGKNTTNESNQVELGATPALTLRLDQNHSWGKIGLAYLTAQLQRENLKTDTSDIFENSQTKLAKVFVEYKKEILNIRAEAYKGQNTEDMSLLALSGSAFIQKTNSTNSENVETSGGFISFSYDYSDKLNFYAGAGGAAHKDAGDILSNNTLASNRNARVGFSHTTEHELKLFVELTKFTSEYVEAGELEEYSANTAEFGLFYNF